jgi:hypothetical protein
MSPVIASPGGRSFDLLSACNTVMFPHVLRRYCGQ